MHAHNTSSPAATEATSDRVGTAHNGGKAKRGLVAAVALVNLVLFCLVLALDAWFFDKAASGDANAGYVLGPTSGAGTSSLLLIVVTFFSAVVGAASCLMAMLYTKLYSEASRLAGITTALLAFGLAVLAIGFAIKALAQGSSGTTAQNVVITIAAIDILMVPMTAALLLLLLGASSRDYGHSTGYATSGAGGLPTTKYAAGHSNTAGTARAAHA